MKSLIGKIVNDSPIEYVGRQLSFPFMHKTGAEAQMAAMGSVGTLFSIVSRTSNATAQVDWKLWRKSRSGKTEDRVEVTKHAALDLWNKPNPFYTRQEFVETFQQHLDLTGEGWWVVGRDDRARSIPLTLWPVRPDRMSPVPDAKLFINGYRYMGPNGERVPLENDEVVMLRMPNPLDPYRGMGPVQSILTELDSSKYSSEWNRNFFLNSAEPGGIIEVDRRLDDDEFDEMAERWQEQHRGVNNAHRIAIIEQGKWVERKYTNRDMQFVELRNVSRDEIREAFGIPKFALGDVDDVNRASAEASEVFFARWLVVPRLERIKGALNADFLPLFGPGSDQLEFDYCNPVPEDRDADNNELTAKANAASTLVTAGFDPAAVLETVGLPEMEFSKPKPPPTPNPPTPEEEAEPGDTQVTAVGKTKIISRFDGKAWRVIEVVVPKS